MQMICDTVGKSGRRIGERQIGEVTPRAADKIYEKGISSPNGLRLRGKGEKVVGLCRKVWRIMRRLHPELFDDKKHPDPCQDDFTLKKPHYQEQAARTVTREEIYKFAWGCIAQGRPEPAAVLAVICFEWLQRPQNVIVWLAHLVGLPPAESGRTPCAAHRSITKTSPWSGTRSRRPSMGRPLSSTPKPRGS